MNLLKLAPNDGEAHYQMAETLWNLQEYGEALWQYKEASRLAPDNTEWRCKLAQVLFVARDYDALARAGLRRCSRRTRRTSTRCCCAAA